MHTSDLQLFTLIILIIVILSGSALTIYNRLENKSQNKLAIFRFKESTEESIDENPLIIKQGKILDPMEKKLLMAIILPINKDGLTVHQLNELLDLSTLKEINQRQKRHIFIKELNLKLYLVTGLRECIIRTNKRSDKRIKYYTIDLKNVNKIKKLAVILLKSNNQKNT